MKKIRIILFLFIFILIELSVNVFAEDRNAPELYRDSLNVSKTNVYTGDIVKYSLEAIDDSGIWDNDIYDSGIESINMVLIHNKTSETKELSFEYNAELVYEAEFEINQNIACGQWDIYYITLKDINDNIVTVYNKPYKYTGVQYYDWSYMSIYNYVNPVLVDGSLSVSKTVLTKNEEVMVSLKTSHPEGIKSVNITYIKPNSTQRFTYEMDGENNEFACTIPFTEYGINGVWQVEKIEIIGVNEDYHVFWNSNGEESMYEDRIDLRIGNFETVGFIEELQAPLLESYEINKTKIDFLEDIKISLKATDDVSGINKFYINYTLPDGSQCNFDVEPDDENYKLEFIDAGTGSYTANYIYIEDNAKNGITYDVERNLDFHIYSPINIKSPAMFFKYSSIPSKNTFKIKVFSYPINEEFYGGIKIESSDPSIASVYQTENGAEITIYNKRGRAFIKAYYVDRPDVYDSIPVYVNNTGRTTYIYKIKSEYKEINMEIGDEIEINPELVAFNPSATIGQKEIFYISENDKIATVTREGKVIAKSLGETSIIVYSKYGGATLEIPVKVGIFARDLEIDVSEINLTEEERTYQIIANIVPNNSTYDITYESLNPKIISVDENGIVTALKNGEGVISVKTTDGKQAKEIKVKVEGLKYELAAYMVSDFQDKTYNQTEQKQNIVVTFEGNELIEDVDYIVKYLNNYNVGTATVIIKGIGKYKGEVIKKFEIKKLFEDVEETEWYFKAIKFCYDKGMIMGTTTITFEPEVKLTRGMLVTILYRIDGKVQVDGDCIFPDVDRNMYYYNAIKWATANGIVKGYEDGKFRPNKNVTREELVVILRNYLRSRGVDTSVTSDLNRFNDGYKVSSFARSAVEWAIANNVITGYVGDNTIKPQGTATRAETAAVLYKYFRNTEI